ncbi:MAG: 50S ribosomal protein L31e [Nanoarchaeota archaeon]|nr:50S ribosomal protein L31e [Nanoarchaeota archaeon]
MAESKIQEREYTIPLRKVWLKAAQYERGRKAIKAIKEFVAKHMKVADRDVNKVKLDVFLNNEIWFRGRRHPPSKVKIKAIKEGDIVKVEFVELPQRVKFHKAKLDRLHKKEDKKETPKMTPKTEEPKTSEASSEKKEEKEKEIAVAELHAKEAKLDAKAQKHLSKKKEESYHRMALKK